MTHQSAADAVGRSRSAASNLLRLLKLPQPVQSMLMENKLDMGHARALLALEGAQQITAANKITHDRLSVRETEKLVQAWLNPKLPQEKPVKSRDVLNLQEELSELTGTNVTIKEKAQGAGQLIIDYISHDHLEALINSLKNCNKVT